MIGTRKLYSIAIQSVFRYIHDEDFNNLDYVTWSMWQDNVEIWVFVWEIMSYAYDQRNKLLIFKSGFPGNLVAAILEGININVFAIIKLLT